MSFQNSLDAAVARIDVLRKEMDTACREGLAALLSPLFAENPSVTAIYWTQRFDSGRGVSLGTIMYTQVLDARAAPRPMLAATGPASLVEFAGFLRSINYHLLRAYGPNVTVTLTRDGISAAPA